MAEIHSFLELMNGLDAAQFSPIEDPPLRREDVLRAAIRVGDPILDEDLKYVAGSTWPVGMIERGNIEIDDVPLVPSADGSARRYAKLYIHRIEARIIPGVDARDGDPHQLLPTDATGVYNDTGRHFGVFETVEQAESYAGTALVLRFLPPVLLNPGIETPMAKKAHDVSNRAYATLKLARKSPGSVDPQSIAVLREQRIGLQVEYGQTIAMTPTAETAEVSHYVRTALEDLTEIIRIAERK